MKNKLSFQEKAVHNVHKISYSFLFVLKIISAQSWSLFLSFLFIYYYATNTYLEPYRLRLTMRMMFNLIKLPRFIRTNLFTYFEEKYTFTDKKQYHLNTNKPLKYDSPLLLEGIQHLILIRTTTRQYGICYSSRCKARDE